MTEYLVRRTLSPLVRDRRPDDILAIRVLDPAMGSGAFLVAACGYLADAYEQALVREGSATETDLGPAERAGFRRAVAQRCLYGVDLNPTAVQLARLSLWLSTLAADRPLTFFDHHLRAGNSLVGASPADIFRQPPGRRVARATPLPLFDADDLQGRLASAVAPRIAFATEPDDTAAIVRAKERALAALDGVSGPLATWRNVADAWCASWFWPDGAPPVWTALKACVRAQSSGMPAATEGRWRDTVASISTRQRFFHWDLEFPEVFFDGDGTPAERGGFDAVVGNPPWDTLRGDPSARPLTTFTRECGCYRLQSDGHANLYQLFAERALCLTRPGGRIGLVMPSGLIADHGCARLRRALFEQCRVDGLLGFDNREAIFPIHRGMRFVLLTATAHEPADTIPARFALHSAATLDDVPDEGSIPESTVLSTALLRRWSGPGLAVPELASVRDREILSRVVDSIPALGDEDGWNAHFGRELNATDDRDCLGTTGLPVLEGKQIEPFEVHLDRARHRIEPSVASRILGARAAFTRARLGYREVAASTNRLTLIAAMIPAGVVTTHTIFVLKTPLPEEVQWFLCGIFNSFVANYLVRLRGGTHVTAAAMDLLRVPKRPPTDPAFLAIAAHARELTREPHDRAAYVDLQVRAARLYGMSHTDFCHVLGTLPLIDRSIREVCAGDFWK